MKLLSKIVYFLLGLFFLNFTFATLPFQGSNGFSLIDYKLNTASELELTFNEQLTFEPISVEIFDELGNEIPIDIIDFNEAMDGILIKFSNDLLESQNYSIKILSVMGTNGSIKAQDSDEPLDLDLDFSGIVATSDEESGFVDAKALFESAVSTNSSDSSFDFQDDSVIDNTLLDQQEETSEFDFMFDEKSNTNNPSTQIIESDVDNGTPINQLNQDLPSDPQTLGEMIGNELQDPSDNIYESHNAANNNSNGTGSVITGIPKTGPAENMFIIFLMLSVVIYYVISRNVNKNK